MSSNGPITTDSVPFNTEPTLAFDALDLDLVLKVLSNTAFSPFFTFFIPVLTYAQEQRSDLPTVYWGTVWFAFVTFFWLAQVASTKWRNGFASASTRVAWEDQIVLITGGASGLGELLANTLAVRNVTVVVLDIKKGVFDSDNVTSYVCDVSQWESVEAIAKQIVEEVGHPTVIVNNAGVVQGRAIVDLSPADVRQTFGVNTLGHFWILKAFLPEMVKQKTGHVVTVSSVMGFVGASRVADYVASKFALVGLHESLRYELDKLYKTPAIRTTLVTPAFMQTAMFSKSQYASRNPNTPLPPWLFRFLAPQVAPHDVVKRIIAALDLHQSQDIRMPFFVEVARLGAVLPSYGRDFLQWVSGADTFMDGFVKVSGRRADEGSVDVTATHDVRVKSD